MAFLIKEGFRAPEELLKPEVLRLFEPSGAEERVLTWNRQLLNILLNNGRLGRLVTTAALAPRGSAVYTLNDMLTDLRNGLWNELKSGKVSTSIYRRNLQRAYLEAMGLKLNPPPPSPPPPGLPPGVIIPAPSPLPGEARALIRAELQDLDGQIARAMPRAVDRETKAHLLDSRYQIEKILHPDKKS